MTFENGVYECVHCGIEFDKEEVMDNEKKCPECLMEIICVEY